MKREKLEEEKKMYLSTIGLNDIHMRIEKHHHHHQLVVGLFLSFVIQQYIILKKILYRVKILCIEKIDEKMNFPSFILFLHTKNNAL